MVLQFDATEELIDFVWDAACCVADLFDRVTPLMILGPRQSHDVALARRAVVLILRRRVWLAHGLSGREATLPMAIHFGDKAPFDGARPISYPMIGHLFGRDHSSFLRTASDRVDATANAAESRLLTHRGYSPRDVLRFAVHVHFRTRIPTQGVHP
jgi:hypothetical protein